MKLDKLKQSTLSYLILNKMNNEEGIKELKLYLKYDLGYSSAEIKKMSIDKIVEIIIDDTNKNPIMGS